MIEGNDGPVTIDPRNGLNRRFHSVRNLIEYSLVEVPVGSDFEVVYNKPNFEIDVTMAPTTDTLTRWDVKGTIDTDIFALLGMRVTAPRRGPTPPMVISDDVDRARELGSIEIVGANARSGLLLYQIQLRLPRFWIEGFLSAVWNPGINPRYRGAWIPTVWVSNTTEDSHMLPQKSPIQPNPDMAVLRVDRLNPGRS